jgi:hypothetical protein
VDSTKLGFPSISIVDDGAPADATSERLISEQPTGTGSGSSGEGSNHA